MKLFSCLFLGFNWQQQSQLTPDSGLNFFKTSINEVERNDKVLKLIETAGTVGQVGSLATEEEQKLMEEVAEDTFGLSESKPARIPLTGEHKLIYSAAPGASSGRVFGNVVGKVSQFFEDDEIFYNRVNFGPLQISLRAKREIMNDTTIKVSFLQTSFNLFGKTLKQGDVGGGGGEFGYR